MRALAKETMTRVRECVRRRKAKQDGPAIIYADGTVPCLECAGTGTDPATGAMCCHCERGAIEVLQEIDAEDISTGEKR
jgi:hypothetical protein